MASARYSLSIGGTRTRFFSVMFDVAENAIGRNILLLCLEKTSWALSLRSVQS